MLNIPDSIVTISTCHTDLTTQITVPIEFPTRIIPVIVIDDIDTAKPLGEILVEENLPVAEVTLRTPAALDAIKRMTSIDGLTVGAGTAITREQAEAAHHAGSQFIVSPALHLDVIEYCKTADVPVIPGIATPSEIATAMSLGLELLKFFPAEALGGAPALKAITSVYPDISVMPTGGITPENIGNYLSLSCVKACGGSWMVPRDLLKEKKYDQIRTLVREASALNQAL